MTFYWWMHWFWITYCMSTTTCRDLITTFRTDKPAVNTSSESSRKLIEIINNPPTNITVPSSLENTTATKNISSKSLKPSSKKFVPLFSNITSPTAKELKEPVILTTLTEANITTDNQSFFNAINNNTSNTTSYLEEELIFNQSSARNYEQIGVEVEENDNDMKISNSDGHLTAAGITGITLGCVIIVGVISAVSYFIYRNQGLNRPQVLNDRCSNPDSSGYIDDASVRDNSEEMYSLDNDSFLNSLEAMTIQNYWTDTVKHTKL